MPTYEGNTKSLNPRGILCQYVGSPIAATFLVLAADKRKVFRSTQSEYSIETIRKQNNFDAASSLAVLTPLLTTPENRRAEFRGGSRRPRPEPEPKASHLPFPAAALSCLVTSLAATPQLTYPKNLSHALQ